ncbi:hypothetical protein ACFQ1M_01120 [Sungkyunkwania multivorans]|uniref:DUF4382 domain-containing protein n=1 Tax=Sungkyunkwania multivorans TaxID=1173618 RepID=A0ABW3CVD4_9FLAO
MKSIKHLFAITCAGVLLLACSADDKTVDTVTANTTFGAVLRTIDQDGAFDMFRVQNSLDLELEEQDKEGGALLDRVELTVSFIDNNFLDEDNETDRESVLNTPFGTIQRDAFAPGGDLGLLRTSYSYTMQEALTAMGVNLTQVLPGDQIALDLELFLTDGRSFDASTASGNVSGGSFFSSPFQYTLTIDDGVDFSISNVRAEGITVADATGININPTATNGSYHVDISIDDDEDGAQLQTLNIYREFVDRSIDDTGTDLSQDEALFDSYTISSLPLVDGARTLNLEYTLMSLYNGLTFTDLGLNDEFNLRYELVTADGRIITTDSDGSEYYVRINVLDCNLLNATAPVSGEYTIKFFDSFGDGWDGAEITVSIDGALPATPYTLLAGSAGEAKFTVPDGATDLVVSYVDGNFEEEHSYQIIAPNGFTAAEDGPNPRVGPIPLAVCE